MMRGTVFLKEWEAQLIADREAAIVTCRCAWCEWTLEGTVAATREAYSAHRHETHPDVNPPPRRCRQRPFGQLTTGKTLDDNIAAARAQGASTWVGDV